MLVTVKVLLFNIDFLSPVSLGTVNRCEAFGKAVKKAVEEPLKTQIALQVGEVSPNHWIIDIWCYNLAISKADMLGALSKLKWMHVQSCTRRVQTGSDDPRDWKKDTTRLANRHPHRDAQRKYKSSPYFTAGPGRPHKHRVKSAR